MDDETALLKAVCDHPDEDTPRLADADWLGENAGNIPGRDPREMRDRAWIHLMASLAKGRTCRQVN